MKTLAYYLNRIEQNLSGNYSFTPDNVFQKGHKGNRDIIRKIILEIMLPQSRINNPEILSELYMRCKKGESCIIMAEHYSNLDFPVVRILMEESPKIGEEAASSLLPIRGMKLSEQDPITAKFTHSYDCIVIYPSRTLDAIDDPKIRQETRKISVPINHAAIKEMIRQKHNGRLLLVFPAGTRYRPWNPDSGKGVREIYSYLKTFDNVVFLSINGNMMPPSKTRGMGYEPMNRDLMILTCSEIINGREFRKKHEAETPGGIDPRQYVVNCVMEKLLELHHRVEPERLRELQQQNLPDYEPGANQEE